MQKRLKTRVIWYNLMVEQIYLDYPKALFIVILYQGVLRVLSFITELTYHIHNLHETEAEIHGE